MTKTLSVTEAAKRLKVNKSTVSRHIQKINDDLTQFAQLHRILSESDFDKIKSSLQRTREEYPNHRGK